MATEFVCKIGTSVSDDRDYTLLSFWEDACNCDLTSSATKVYTTVKSVGTMVAAVVDGSIVYLYRGGVRLDCSAILLHATTTQTLVKNIQGTATPQIGDQWRRTTQNTYGWVTIQNSGDSVIAVAECYFDSQGSVADRLIFNTWTTSAINYIKMYVPRSQRHLSTSGTGYAIEGNRSFDVITLNNVDIRIEGFEIFGGRRHITGTYRSGTHTVRIHDCILHDNYWGPTIDVPDSANLTVMLWNSILYNTYRGAVDGSLSRAQIYVENCTVYNPGSYGIIGAQCYNVVVHQGAYKGFTCFSDDCTGDYNCDGLESGTDETAPGSNSLHNKTLQEILWAMPFVAWSGDPFDPSIRNADFHIYPTSPLSDVGTDRSSGDIGFTTDIDGYIRTIPWSIGADQYIESSSSSSISVSSSSSSFSSSSSSSFSSSSWSSCSSSFSSSSWSSISVSFSSSSFSSCSSSFSSSSSSFSSCSSSFSSSSFSSCSSSFSSSSFSSCSSSFSSSSWSSISSSFSSSSFSSCSSSFSSSSFSSSSWSSSSHTILELRTYSY